MQVVIESKTYIVDMICEKCKTGVMRPTSIVLTSNPPQYPHKCNYCGNEKVYDKCYPFQIIEKENHDEQMETIQSEPTGE